MSKRQALARLSVELVPVIEKDIRDPMIADHLRMRILRLVEEMLDEQGKAILSNE